MTYAKYMSALRNLSFAAMVAIPVTASAQDASSESKWIKICSQDETSGTQLCNVSNILLAQNGSLIASFSIQTLPENKIAIGTFVPLGFVIPAGVQLAVDGEAKATAQFTICVPPSNDGPAGCAARAELGGEFIESLRRGNKLAIVLANTQGQAIPIELSLIGFSKTYDGEGLDPVAARAHEVEQSRQLQEDARAAFQRMIERQQAESGVAPN